MRNNDDLQQHYNPFLSPIQKVNSDNKYKNVENKNKIQTPSIKSLFNIENANLFIDKNSSFEKDKKFPILFSIIKPNDKTNDSLNISNEFLANILNSCNKEDDRLIEMKNEINDNENTLNFEQSNTISDNISNNISNISSSNELLKTFYTSRIADIDKMDNFYTRNLVTNIERILKVEYNYSKSKKARFNITTHSSNFFITFIDNYNSLFQYHLIYNYLKHLKTNIDYLLCVKDKVILKNNLSKFHLYLQFSKGVELCFSKLNTKDVYTFNKSALKISEIMKDNGYIIDEMGTPKNKGPYCLNLNKKIENDNQDEIDMNLANSEFDIATFSQNIEGMRQVYYFYGKYIDDFNDILMSYLKHINDDYELVYINDLFWEGFRKLDAPIGFYPNFNDENVLLEDFLKFISYNKISDIFNTKDGQFKNKYQKIIITTDKSPDELYENFRRLNWVAFFHIYQSDDILDVQNLHSILNFEC